MTSHQDEPRRHAPGMPRAGDAAVPTADAGEASNHLGQDDGADVNRAKDRDRDAKAPKPSDRLPAAGPHADPALTNPDATPGTGALTPPGQHDDSDSTSS